MRLLLATVVLAFAAGALAQSAPRPLPPGTKPLEEPPPPPAESDVARGVILVRTSLGDPPGPGFQIVDFAQTKVFLGAMMPPGNAEDFDFAMIAENSKM